jgi:ABC-type Mn2+/Zn2+ transport system ATPase subunit
MSITEALAWIAGLPKKLSDRERTIAYQLFKEITARLGFLVDVGLDYLALDRASITLSGGEAQRIRLATQIGTTLMGVLYILDEPSIGLHQRDNAKLIATLTRLRDLGNTVLVVEHDEETIRTADWVVDIGPGAGEHGGEIIANGPLEDVLHEPRSVTGAFLRGERAVPIPAKRRKGNGKKLGVRGAREHNLRKLNVDVPLGTFTAVTGVSGSGKSTLVTDVLYRALARELNGSREPVGAHDRLVGADHVDKIVEIDQSPIGRRRARTRRRTRAVRADPGAVRGRPGGARPRLLAGPFSFNVKGGRCENCKGDGILKIEMQFLPDVYVTCEVCKGKRYNREALEIHFKGRSIADVLEMTIAEAVDFFSAVPNVQAKLQTLYDVGLGLRPSGQPATTLSGGEAQRVKLATELSRRATGPNAVRPRRADDRPPLRRRREAARGPPPARRRRQHGPRHRAQPRRDQDGRLDRRPGPGGGARAAGSSPRARPRRSRRRPARRRASTSPGCSAASRSCRCRTCRSPRLRGGEMDMPTRRKSRSRSAEPEARGRGRVVGEWGGGVARTVPGPLRGQVTAPAARSSPGRGPSPGTTGRPPDRRPPTPGPRSCPPGRDRGCTRHRTRPGS